MPNGRHVRIEPEDLFSAEAAAPGPRARPPPHALGPFFVLGVKEWHHKEPKATDTAASAVAAFSGISVTKNEPTSENTDSGVAGAAAAGGERVEGAQASESVAQ